MENNRSGALLAFLVGGAVGAALALLYAPGSGSETRRKIRDGFDDASDWAKDKYDDTKERIDDGAGKVRQIISDKKEDVVSAFEAGKDAFHKGKERLTRETSST